jgi:hypothetical protein
MISGILRDGTGTDPRGGTTAESKRARLRYGLRMLVVIFVAAAPESLFRRGNETKNLPGWHPREAAPASHPR